MSVRVDRVAPDQFAIPASRILRDAWRPPCLDYSPEYVAWQIGFPGAVPAVAVAASDGDEPVGCAALLPRRVRFRGHNYDIFILTFVAVRPGWRGRGIGPSVYAALLDAARAGGPPIVVFVEPSSAGRRLLLESLDAARLAARPLGTYHAHAGMAGPQPAGGEPGCVTTRDRSEYRRAASESDDRTTLCADPTDEQLDHYLSDPRGRELVVGSAAAGGGRWAAMVVSAEVVAAGGPERRILIDSIAGLDPSADFLRGLVRIQGGRPGSRGPVAVTAPNVHGIDPTTLRAAGLRRIPSVFEAYLAVTGPDHPILAAEGTNLEII
jgi:GNAT superfamily N-acetyltransferase